MSTIELVQIIAVCGGVVTMLLGLWLVFARLKEKQQGFGPNALKALGVVLFLPLLLVIWVAVPSIGTETLAALLGTIAGYVLSQADGDDK